MIITIAIVLGVLWLAGLLTSHVFGGLLHTLIVIAVILIILNLLHII